MDLDELKNKLLDDVQINKANLMSELSNNSLKHSKYLNYLHKINQQIVKLNSTLKKKRGELFLYYSGKDPEKICELVMSNATEVKSAIESNDEYVELQLKLDLMKEYSEYLTDACKIFSNRGFALQKMVDLKRFENGL